MAGFIFRLQNLLVLKEKVEEQKKEQYGQAMQELEQAMIRRDQIGKEAEAISHELKRHMSATFCPRDVVTYNRYIGLLNKKYQLQEQTVIQKQRTVDKKRELVLEAMKERKMLESLKEKDFIKYQEEEKKSEQKSIDEIVSFQYKNHQY